MTVFGVRPNPLSARRVYQPAALLQRRSAQMGPPRRGRTGAKTPRPSARRQRANGRIPTKRDYRAQRKPVPSDAPDGPSLPSTVSGPERVPTSKSGPYKSPPRRSAPGSPVVAAPARHWSSPVGLTPALQAPHAVDRGTQSATHS
jgi:hypothetical protein